MTEPYLLPLQDHELMRKALHGIKGSGEKEPGGDDRHAMDIYRTVIQGFSNVKFETIQSAFGEDAKLVQQAAERELTSRLARFVERDPKAPNPRGLEMYDYYLSAITTPAQYFHIDMAQLFRNVSNLKKEPADRLQFKAEYIILNSYKTAFGDAKAASAPNAIEHYLSRYLTMREWYDALAARQQDPKDRAMLVAFHKELEPLHAELKEITLNELQRRKLSFGNLRKGDKAVEVGDMMLMASTLFHPEDDKRFTQLRTDLQNEPTVIKPLLQKIRYLIESPNPAVHAKAEDLFRLIYPDTDQSLAGAEILALTNEKIRQASLPTHRNL